MKSFLLAAVAGLFLSLTAQAGAPNAPVTPNKPICVKPNVPVSPNKPITPNVPVSPNKPVTPYVPVKPINVKPINVKPVNGKVINKGNVTTNRKTNKVIQKVNLQ